MITVDERCAERDARAQSRNPAWLAVEIAIEADQRAHEDGRNKLQRGFAEIADEDVHAANLPAIAGARNVSARFQRVPTNRREPRIALAPRGFEARIVALDLRGALGRHLEQLALPGLVIGEGDELLGPRRASAARSAQLIPGGDRGQRLDAPS